MSISPELLTNNSGELVILNERPKNMSFKEYKTRLRVQKAFLKMRLRGVSVWNPTGDIVARTSEGTLQYPDNEKPSIFLSKETIRLARKGISYIKSRDGKNLLPLKPVERITMFVRSTFHANRLEKFSVLGRR